MVRGVILLYVNSKNNTRIAVYDTHPNQCQKETVVFIHGWPLSNKIFEYQTEILVRTGYRVVTIDLRGFGNSDAPACGYSYDQFADDINAVVRSLKLCSFILVGFSMGGAIALRYMGRHNGFGVKKLILLGAAAPRFTQCPGYPYGVTKDYVDNLIAQASTDRAQLSADFGGMLFEGCHSKAIINWFRDIALSASGVGTIQSAISLRDEDGRCDLRKVRVPTGIFHGKKDRIVPYELALLQKEGISNSILYPLENSGHGVFYDDLDYFNQCFLDFIKNCY